MCRNDNSTFFTKRKAFSHTISGLYDGLMPKWRIHVIRCFFFLAAPFQQWKEQRLAVSLISTHISLPPSPFRVPDSIPCEAQPSPPDALNCANRAKHRSDAPLCFMGTHSLAQEPLVFHLALLGKIPLCPHGQAVLFPQSGNLPHHGSGVVYIQRLLILPDVNEQYRLRVCQRLEIVIAQIARLSSNGRGDTALLHLGGKGSFLPWIELCPCESRLSIYNLHPTKQGWHTSPLRLCRSRRQYPTSLPD